MQRFTPAFLLLLALAAACHDQAAVPTADRPLLAAVAAATCPAHATFVVSDENSLLSAVAAAQPHDTIALTGMVGPTFSDVLVQTDSLTFTCATPGSGLRAAPNTHGWLFVLLSRQVTLEHLTLDAGNTLNGAVVAFNGVEGPLAGVAADLRLVGDRVHCAAQHAEPCLSIRNHAAGVAGVLISGDTVVDDAGRSTISLDGGVSNARVEGNTIEGTLGVGGVGDDVRVVGNHIRCSGQGQDTCVSMASDAPGVHNVLIASNTLESDAPIATILLFGVHDVRVEDNTIDGSSGLFGLALFEFGDDVRLARNHFLCAGHHQESCVHMESDVGGLQRALISSNTFEVDNQLTILLVGANEARVEKNTIRGILAAGGNGDPVIFITVTHGRFSGNTAECGDACVFGAGSPGLVVAANQFQTAGSSTGIHLQEGTDGDSVVGNTIVTTVPSFVPQFGGIRVRDGTNAVVTDNIVRGPWANSLALTDMTGTDVERNTLQGAVRFGIGAASEQAAGPISITANMFRANRVTGAGMAGILARLACGNTFVGNNLQGNAGNLGLVFDATSGANTYAGDRTVVVDNGAFDCNGDGVNDPNVISGPGVARHGLGVGFGTGGLGATPRTVHGIALK
jgi:Right handed beta helix region